MTIDKSPPVTIIFVFLTNSLLNYNKTSIIIMLISIIIMLIFIILTCSSVIIIGWSLIRVSLFLLIVSVRGVWNVMRGINSWHMEKGGCC